MDTVGTAIGTVVAWTFLAAFLLLLAFVGLRSLARVVVIVVLLLIGLRVRAPVRRVVEDDGQDGITLYWPVVDLRTLGGREVRGVRMFTPLPAPPRRSDVVVRYLPGLPRLATSPSLLILVRSAAVGGVVPSLFEFAGGEQAIHRLEQAFYASVLADPLLQPLFGAGQARHVDTLTAFTAESFGGPDTFSRETGFGHLIDVHRGLGITQEQRLRFVELYRQAMDAVDLPDDADFRAAVLEHVDFGTRVAMQNSNAKDDADLHPLREVPRWTWSGDDA